MKKGIEGKRYACGKESQYSFTLTDDKLDTVVVEMFGERFKGRINWYSKRPTGGMNYIEVYEELTKETKEKLSIRDGQDIIFSVPDETKKEIISLLKNKYEQFEKELLDGRRRIYATIVGCDYPHPAPSVKEKGKWDVLYYLLAEKFNVWNAIERGDFKDGEDITEKVIDLIKKQQAKIKKEEEMLKAGKGAVAFNRCWECGVCRIVGKMTGKGGYERMPKEEWREVNAAFIKAWQKQFEGHDGTILSSVGTSWTKCFEEEGYKAIIVSKDYCGC